MKHLLLLFINLIICTGFSIKSQGYDLKSIPASYSGDLNVSIDNQVVNSSSNIKIGTEVENDALTVSLLAFSINIADTDIDFGDVIISNIEIDKDGKITKGYAEINHPVLSLIKINIAGTMTSEKADLDLDILWNNITIIVKYNGVAINEGYDLSKIPSSYVGNLAISVANTETSNSNNVEVTTFIKDGKLSLKVSNLSIVMGEDIIPFGDITVPGIELDSDGNINKIDMSLQHPTLGELPLSMTGLLTDIKSSLKINITYNKVIPIDVNFEGKAKTSSLTSVSEKNIECIVGDNYILVDNAQIKSFSLYNISGRNIRSKNILSNRIDFDNISTGIYIADIITDKGRITRKIAIK
ncbi:MAG: calycin-like domain-containing protein [Bacteroidales bacterium]|nr:calycin-like domain-containing protein [Bacteroidales bacterium]